MNRKRKLLLRVAASLVGTIVLLIVAAVITIQTAWFANLVRTKIIAAAEDATGGVAEIQEFQFDLRHFALRLRGCILHGTEPKGADPLLTVKLLELRFKLFSGLTKAIDLRYLGVEQPRLNLLLLPDGTTNIPQPKMPATSSQTSGLQTVVDLAVTKFQLDKGVITVFQRQAMFSGRGENLRVLLNYSTLNPSYSGSLKIDPLILASGTKPPLRVRVDVPVTLEPDAIRVANAKLITGRSDLVLSGSMTNMNAPLIQASLNASINLSEIGESVELPIRANAKDAPKELKAEISGSLTEKTNTIHLESARLRLGQTTLEAAGNLSPDKQGAVEFNANMALAELSQLLDLGTVQASGDLQANGRATLNRQSDYEIDGTLKSRALSLRNGTTRLSDLSLQSPFHADPYLISLDGLKLNVLDGSLAAKIFLEKLQMFSIEAHLQGFSVPHMAETLTGKHLGYDGTLGGSVLARGDLKAKGMTGYRANADLAIVPGRRGIPLSGQLHASYAGATGAFDLQRSYIGLPNSQLDAVGSLSRQIELKLSSRNLNDLLPAFNFGSTRPETSLPVVLQNGEAIVQARVTGGIATPYIAAHAEMNGFAVDQHPFDRLAVNIAASPSFASLQDGSLTAKGSGMSFDASIGLAKWTPRPSSPITANLTLRNGNLGDLASLAGENALKASGAVTVDVHVDGTYGDPLGSAALKIMDGSLYEQPFSMFAANLNLADQLITLSQLQLDTAGGTVTAKATFRHPKDRFTVGLAQLRISTDHVQLAKVQALARQNAGVAGTIQLNANLTAEASDKSGKTNFSVSDVTADFSARNLQVQNQKAGNLTASAKTSGGRVGYAINSDFAGSLIKIDGSTDLTKDYFTTADASVQNLSVAQALQLAGQAAIPASGNLSATAHLRGVLDAPNADFAFALDKASLYQEPIGALKGHVTYSNSRIDIPSIRLDVPAGSLTLSGTFNHLPGNLNKGSLNLKIDSSDIQLARIEHVRQQEPGLGGTVRLSGSLAGNMRDERGRSMMLISNLNADASATNLHIDRASLGSVSFNARTIGSTLHFRMDSDIAKSQIHGTGEAQLTGNYPVAATLSFANVRYANLAPLLSEETVSATPYDALIDGEAALNGPILDPDNLTARLQLNRLDLRTAGTPSATGSPARRTVELQNQGPVVVELKNDVVQIEQLHISGRDTALNASGRISLKDLQNPLAVKVDASVNLGLLQDADRDFYSSGSLTMNVNLRGSFTQPRANGRIELKGANVNYADSPNGLSNANGVILLNGTNASIQNLSGESGGGKITLSGFVGLAAGVPNFNLRATASKVRVRSSGISVTSDATLALSGNVKRSLLGGNITVERISYASSSDAGSLLSTVSTPPSVPSSPSPFLSGMRIDIHVMTSPDLQVISTYANRLSVLANLTVRGTAETPGMLGRMTVTDGQLVFFGNTYTVTTGTVNFYDPNAITPVLNVSLNTVAQGVDVTLGVTGPMDDLKLNYRSDPPLSFEQIVQLLATNTTPTNAVIAAHQPTPPQQSLSQMGESAVLGQAVANPLASRVQRVFGLSQLKIDPSVAGANGPTANVTLQEKIASNITFTYITDVRQTNSQTVRVQWDLTNNLSAVGLRDYNGNVSVQLQYKFTRR